MHNPMYDDKENILLLVHKDGDHDHDYDSDYDYNTANTLVEQKTLATS